VSIQRFIIEGTIEQNYKQFQKIKNILGLYPEENNDIVLILKRVDGGDVQEIFELINSIRYSETKVTLCAYDYLISAGALLYFYLLLNITENDFKNVTFSPLVSELMVVFHRPRIEEIDHIRFSEDIPESVNECTSPRNLDEQTKIIDNTFEKLLGFLGFNGLSGSHHKEGYTHKAEHVRSIYYSNGDFIFKYFEHERYE